MAGLVFIALGAAFAAYGVAVMTVWSGSLFFCFWYVVGAACVGVGVAMRTGAWEAVPLPLRAALAAAAAVVVAVVAVTSVTVMREAEASRPQRLPDDLEYVVVLGAQVRQDGSPSPVLRYRLDAAYDYAATHPVCKVVVSGGQGLNEPMSEADCMATYLRERGLDQARVLREDRATNTVENVRFAAEVMRGQGSDPATAKVGVVTNDFHLYRAVRLARHAGVPGAVGVWAKSTPLYLPNNLARECLGIAKDTLQGNM